VNENQRVKHDLRNAVAIGLANLEGMADGIVAATPERLEAVAESLRRARDLIDRLPSD
jgi:malonyl CoA-acyl carrier protein transacylase